MLIVDGSVENRVQLAVHLANAGWTIKEAHSGAAGLELARLLPAVVVVDETLPDMSGVEFRSALKRDADLRKIPVIVVSTEVVGGGNDRWDENAEIYLSKPVNLRELVATMKGLFQLGLVASKSEKNLAHLSLMIDSMMEGVITIARDGRILSMNPAAKQIYGWSKSNTLPRDLDEMDDKYERTRTDGTPLPRSEWPGARALRGETVRGQEVRIVNRETGRAWVGSFNATPLHDDGDFDLIILTVFDVTARKADEAELERKVAERTSSLREAIAQMEEFSYTVSHDLRAPLRSIKGYAEVLANDHAAKLKGDAAAFLERIIENGNRMERLVNDVLTMSRISSTKVRLETIDLNTLLHAIVREYPNFQTNIAQISIDPLPPVTGHESLCTQVFANLLGNAAKFVSPGVVPKIHVWAEPRADFVRLNVQDNGIGIPPEFHQKIFGMFERLDPENHFGGTGIGLAIVRRAAEKMNGRVGVESVEGNGSLFWVDLPKAAA